MLGNLFERRGTFQSLWGSGALFDRSSYSGVTVTEDTSLRLSAVYACVRLISDTISTLPVDQFIRRDGQRFPYRPREGVDSVAVAACGSHDVSTSRSSSHSCSTVTPSCILPVTRTAQSLR